MSRIGTFANVEANEALNQARRIIADAGRRIDRLARQKQCDPDDMAAIERARDRLDKAMGAM